MLLLTHSSDYKITIITINTRQTNVNFNYYVFNKYTF